MLYRFKLILFFLMDPFSTFFILLGIILILIILNLFYSAKDINSWCAGRRKRKQSNSNVGAVSTTTACQQFLHPGLLKGNFEVSPEIKAHVISATSSPLQGGLGTFTKHENNHSVCPAVQKLACVLLVFVMLFFKTSYWVLTEYILHCITYLFIIHSSFTLSIKHNK